MNSLMLNIIAVPQDFSAESWMQLAEMAEYFCLPSIKSVCQSQLCSKLSQSNSSVLQTFADEMGMKNLSIHCANNWLKSSSRDEKGGEWAELLKEMMRLEIAHSSWQPSMKGGKKVSMQGVSEQKENNRECSNL